ncbi:MAG: hypothetical protein F4114_01105, partial [Rhodospirillaceae bacterium]|nr:hypothetical protein [Rhodospirillaceae bacterium]
MKRPTIETKKWHRIHAYKLNKRRKKRFNGTEFASIIDSNINYPTYVLCPTDFTLETNFEGVVDVLNQIRRISSRERNELIKYIDFRSIRQLSETAALVLAAELDRFNQHPLRKGRRLFAIDVEEWDQSVRRKLAEMGFFDLLNA